MYKVFIVEDDRVIAQAMSNHLQAWDCEVLCASDYKNVLREFLAFNPQLVLLDISLPFFNGYHWCMEIRKVSQVPIVYVSSASDNLNIVMAMNMGGDDFIAKPFDLDVLLVKVQAVLRRSYHLAVQSPMLEHRGALLNTADATLLFEGVKIDLSRNEYRILLTLLENKGCIVARDVLMTRLWESDSYVDENALTVNVTRLRKKLDAVGLSDYISTKRGEGYILE